MDARGCARSGWDAIGYVLMWVEPLWVNFRSRFRSHDIVLKYQELFGSQACGSKVVETPKGNSNGQNFGQVGMEFSEEFRQTGTWSGGDSIGNDRGLRAVGKMGRGDDAISDFPMLDHTNSRRPNAHPNFAQVMAGPWVWLGSTCHCHHLNIPNDIQTSSSMFERRIPTSNFELRIGQLPCSNLQDMMLIKCWKVFGTIFCDKFENL